MSEDLKTPIYENHKQLGAKMVPFGGWLMPVSYQSVLTEHETVRTTCGLFDVSHMGEIFVEGAEAEKFLNWLTINDVTKLSNGKGQYTAILNEKGGMIDDLILYRLDTNHYLLCVNASNIEKDYSWVESQASKFDVKTSNQSSSYSQFAIQGPTSTESLKNILNSEDFNTASSLSYTGIAEVTIEGSPALIARTGYTGEKGYELYLKNEYAVNAWQALVNGEQKVTPIGLGARDTLRLEACYLLYGNDMNDTVTPLEAGISWATKIDKGDFVGRDALIAMKESGVPRKIIAFKLDEKGIARGGMDIYLGEQKIGQVTSGSVLPTVGGAGGMAIVDSKSVKVEDKIEIDVRGRRKSATVVKKPLYQAKTHS
jgi:aminomethyltransferase